MNYNIIALFLIDFVINTNRETISFIYTQNFPRNRVNNTQNPKTYMYIIINESKHLHGYYWLGYPRAHDENPSLAGKNPDFILSALLDSWALILK